MNNAGSNLHSPSGDFGACTIHLFCSPRQCDGGVAARGGGGYLQLPALERESGILPTTLQPAPRTNQLPEIGHERRWVGRGPEVVTNFAQMSICLFAQFTQIAFIHFRCFFLRTVSLRFSPLAHSAGLEIKCTASIESTLLLGSVVQCGYSVNAQCCIPVHAMVTLFPVDRPRLRPLNLKWKSHC